MDTFPEHTDDSHGLPGRLVVKGPAALAAALPYLFDVPLPGSLVLAHVGPDSTLRLMHRHELPPHPRGASPEVMGQWAGDIGRLLSLSVRLADQDPADYLAVVVYLPAELHTLPEWFGRSVLGNGVVDGRVLDVIAVLGESWRSLACHDETCCPLTGRPVLDDSDATLVAAELVAAGRSVPQAAHRRRGPVPAGGAVTGEAAAILAAMGLPKSIKARRALLRRAWPMVKLPGQELSAETAAILAMAADRPGVRDALLIRMAKAAPRRIGFWEDQFDLWDRVRSAVPARWGAGPSCLAAVAAWSLGDEARARAALDLAQQAEPDHRMAVLIGQLLDRRIGAADWFERMKGISEADCLRFDRPPPAALSGAAGGSRAAG